MDGRSSAVSGPNARNAIWRPGIVVTPQDPSAEVRIKLKARLSGTYWTANSGTATVSVSGDEPIQITRKILPYADDGEREITVQATLPATEAWSFTFVRDDTIVPERPYLVGPPAVPSPQIRAIR